MWIIDLFLFIIGEYLYVFVNVYNFFSLIGVNYKDSFVMLLFFSYYMWGFIFIVVIIVFLWFIYIKGCSFKYVVFVVFI